jgi:hypothetical protein
MTQLYIDDNSVVLSCCQNYGFQNLLELEEATVPAGTEEATDVKINFVCKRFEAVNIIFILQRLCRLSSYTVFG